MKKNDGGKPGGVEKEVTEEEPHWVRPKAQQLHLPTSPSGPPDASGSLQGNKIRASCCTGLSAVAYSLC